MIIHICDSISFKRPRKNSKVMANCKNLIRASHPVKVALDNEHICETCRMIHEARPRIPRLETFTFQIFETEEEEKEAEHLDLLAACACG